jgi:hypothetical protein
MGSKTSRDGKAADVHVVELDSESSDLGHVPKQRFNISKLAKSLTSKEAWLGDYVSNSGWPGLTVDHGYC